MGRVICCHDTGMLLNITAMSSPTKLAFAKAADAKINPPKSGGVGTASITPTNKAASNKSKLVKGAKKIGNAVAGKKKQLKKGVGGKGKATSPKTKKVGKEEGGDGTPTKTNARGMGGEGGQDGQDGQDVSEPKTDILPQPEAPPELAAAPEVKGKVKIRYNHYCEEMEIEATEGKCDGTINVAKIVDLLALDFAFPGNFITHLNTSARLERLDRLWNPKNEAGTITGLQIGKGKIVTLTQCTNRN